VVIFYTGSISSAFSSAFLYFPPISDLDILNGIKSIRFCTTVGSDGIQGFIMKG